jgi:isoleucyl-tRNA synthetase
VQFQSDEQIINAINTNLDYIKTETLTETLEILETLNTGIEVAFDDVNTKLFIKKI